MSRMLERSKIQRTNQQSGSRLPNLKKKPNKTTNELQINEFFTSFKSPGAILEEHSRTPKENPSPIVPKIKQNRTFERARTIFEE